MQANMRIIIHVDEPQNNVTITNYSILLRNIKRQENNFNFCTFYHLHPVVCPANPSN
jgi:hypothetical protein